PGGAVGLLRALVRGQQGLAGGDPRGAAASGLRLRGGRDRVRTRAGVPAAALLHARLHLPDQRGPLLGPGEVGGRLEEAAEEVAAPEQVRPPRGRSLRSPNAPEPSVMKLLPPLVVVMTAASLLAGERRAEDKDPKPAADIQAAN